MQEKAAEEVYSSGTVAFLTDNSDKGLFLSIFLTFTSVILKYESHVWPSGGGGAAPPQPPGPGLLPAQLLPGGA